MRQAAQIQRRFGSGAWPAALMLAAAALLAACDRPGSGPQAAFNNVDITGAEYASALSLPDTQGQPRSLADWKGKVVVVFFGYAQCPDVCPTTLNELAQVKQRLGTAGSQLQGVFVTVDPERDTADVLRSYVGAFGSDFVALRGTPEETRAAAQSFKLFYAKVPGKTPDSYTIDHTAGSYVFDKQGRVRLFVRYGQPIEGLVSDIGRLMAEEL